MAAKPNSKFRRVTIHGKTYYFYEIRWIDVLGDTGHASLKEFADMKPARMVTNAYIFKKDKKFIWTFASYDVHDEVFSDRNLFPVGVIEGLKRIAIT